MINNLQARFGVYAVLENHDYWIDADSVAKLLNEVGATLLRNKIVTNWQHFFIGGVDDFLEGSSLPDIALKDVAANDTVLMLSHGLDVNIQLQDRDTRVKSAPGNGWTHRTAFRLFQRGLARS